jgi:hypothetical protein
MSRILSMPNLFTALTFSATLGLCAGIGVTSIRQPGASLDTSLRNEAYHAQQQAVTWLVASQNADGSWGTSNQVRLTSLALFALSASHPSDPAESTVRAALWLDAHVTNSVTDLDAQAWRLLALAQALPDSPTRPAWLRRVSNAGRPLEAGASADSLRLWSEALNSAGLGEAPPPDQDATNRLARLAATWPPQCSDNRRAWQQAHLINRAGNGQLMRGNTPLDWRRDLAQRLVNTQRNAPAGGGYWDGADVDTRLAETVFGILTLLEL